VGVSVAVAVGVGVGVSICGPREGVTVGVKGSKVGVPGVGVTVGVNVASVAVTVKHIFIALVAVGTRAAFPEVSSDSR